MFASTNVKLHGNHDSYRQNQSVNEGPTRKNTKMQNKLKRSAPNPTSRRLPLPAAVGSVGIALKTVFLQNKYDADSVANLWHNQPISLRSHRHCPPN